MWRKAVFILLFVCLCGLICSPGPAQALSVNWKKRMELFSHQLNNYMLAQEKRLPVFEREGKNFVRRMEGQVRAFQGLGRGFSQATPPGQPAL